MSTRRRCECKEPKAHMQNSWYDTNEVFPIARKEEPYLILQGI